MCFLCFEEKKIINQTSFSYFPHFSCFFFKIGNSFQKYNLNSLNILLLFTNKLLVSSCEAYDFQTLVLQHGEEKIGLRN